MALWGVWGGSLGRPLVVVYRPALLAAGTADRWRLVAERAGLPGLFLALACLLGIAATGSVFELAYGEPDLGSTATGWILAGSLPGTLLALVIAIRINKPA